MRLVQVSVPAGKRQAVLGVLDAEDIDYVVTEETSGREYVAVVSFPLPVQAVEPVLDSLRSVGIDEEAYTVVLDAETVISRQFEQLERRYDDPDTGMRIARDELHAAATDLVPARRTYIVMSVISAVIAAAGLLLNSPAIVVGSMVIAPLIGPAMAASVGTVIGDEGLFTKGMKLQVGGLLLTIAAAAAFAFVVKVFRLIPPGLEVTTIPQVRERLEPDFLSLAVALGAGVAGVLSMSSGVSAALVGVMIAVALVPPAATVGIGIAWGLPMVVLSAGVLALVNGLSINLAAIATLWYRGYRPGEWFLKDRARSAMVTRLATLAVAILVLSVFLGGVTLTSFQHATFEEEVRADLSSTLGAEPYESLTLLSLDVTYDGGSFLGTPTNVTVTVGHPPSVEPPPDLAGALARSIDEATGRDVSLQVRFVAVERAA